MKNPLPDADLHFQFIRATGPGGQNVNKVATAAQLRFDLAGTRALPEPVKARLRALAGQRLTIDGAIVITARAHRTQLANRREALQRLEALITAAETEPKLRRATRPTAGSRQRRLESKGQRKRVKQLRGRIAPE